jgi:mono/diheme cytochrome c family protein
MPSEMAAAMWHHAPRMWAAMQRQGIQPPKLTQDEASDLFAYFYAARYAATPGDARNGERLFARKHCAGCHGTPADAWKAIADPIALAQQMWNHAARATPPGAARWPRLGSRDVADIVTWLRTRPANRELHPEFSPGSPATGGELFGEKGCANCHTYLGNRYPARTMTDFAVAMANHRMQRMVPLTHEEMRSIVAYLWSIQYFDERGDPGAGKKVFIAKGCSSCHEDGSYGAPGLARAEKRTGTSIVSALSARGPSMLSRMREKGIEWPEVTSTEMADLLAYLNTLKTLRTRQSAGR